MNQLERMKTTISHKDSLRKMINRRNVMEISSKEKKDPGDLVRSFTRHMVRLPMPACRLELS